MVPKTHRAVLSARLLASKTLSYSDCPTLAQGALPLVPALMEVNEEHFKPNMVRNFPSLHFNIKATAVLSRARLDFREI